MYPSTLSFDWGMDAIPRLTSLLDSRNLLSLVFYAVLAKAICVNVNILRTRLPILLESQRRKPRALKKRKVVVPPAPIAAATTAATTATATATATVVSTKSAECLCTVCKQGLNIRHTSSCRANNNNNVPSPSVKCGCPSVRHPSPSPSPTPPAPRTAKILPASLSAPAKIGRDYKRSPIKNTSVSTLIPAGNSDSAINDTINDGTPITVTVHTPTAATAVLLSIALLALPFLPAANLFFYVGFVVAERILYLPSVGYCLLVGLGMGRLMDPNRGPFRSQRKRWAALFCVGLVLMAYSVKTFNRNGDWRDEESLYRSAIGVNPPKGNFSYSIESICSTRSGPSNNFMRASNFVNSFCLTF